MRGFATPDHAALHARLTPGRIAARDLASGAQWTYAALDHDAGRLAGALRARGLRPGDRVATLARNRTALLLLHLACARAGMVYVPLNWRLALPELRGLLADCEPAVLFGDDLAAHGALQIECLETFVSNASADGHVPPPEPADADRASLILYTSGTSGRPKGVVLTERAIERTAMNFGLLGRVTPDSVFLCDGPMFHVIGLVTTLRSALQRGACVLISDGFVPDRTLGRLGDPANGVTHYFCVPQMAAALRADPTFDARALLGVTLFSGGAPHDPRAVRAWLDDGIAIADGFGMTETGTVSCMPLDPQRLVARAGSAGLIPPGVALRVVDEHGDDVDGAPGELLVRGENVASGYWRRPDETARAFTPDGWFRTGDIARVDADGFLWIVDRKKDMFISGGENVYPAEIEAALSEHPDVAEAAVVGVPDDRWGEVGHLYLAWRRGVAEPGAEAVKLFLRARLAGYKVPAYVTAVDALPRGGTGKVLKSALRTNTRP